MRLTEFLSLANKLAKENPEALNYEVITSTDDEGNGFNLVSFAPSIGVYDDGNFIPIDCIKENGYKKKDVNAVCLN